MEIHVQVRTHSLHLKTISTEIILKYKKMLIKDKSQHMHWVQGRVQGSEKE